VSRPTRLHPIFGAGNGVLEGHQLVPIRGDNYGASGTHHKSPYYSARKLSSPYINDMLSPLLTPHLTEHSRPSGDGLFTVVVLRSLVHWTAYLLAQGSDAPSMSMTRLTMPSRSAVEIPALLSCQGSTFGLSSIEECTSLVSCKCYLIPPKSWRAALVLPSSQLSTQMC
jgi:hypothetical protein